MEAIGEILKQSIPQNRRDSLAHIFDLTPKERKQRQIDRMNEEPGDLNEADGYNCEKCKNRGFVFHMTEDKAPNGETVYGETSTPCQCRTIRSSIRRMKRSGLENIVKKCTFEKFEVTEPWQKHIKEAAEKFAAEVESLENKWFFIGGGIGTGKTHLCTAIARKLLYDGHSVKYMLWVDESTRLKAIVNDDVKYSELITELKTAEVLYVDDFFKIVRDGYGQELKPTAADIKLAYEIINHRYQHPELITIISSERHIGEIEGIDSAVGSRIYEKTRGNAYNIARDKNRNYRTRDMQVI